VAGVFVDSRNMGEEWWRKSQVNDYKGLRAEVSPDLLKRFWNLGFT
jgi:hypothetical protein